MMPDDEIAAVITQILNVVVIMLLIAVPAAIIVRLMRAPHRTPLDILKQRLARGEISETEYLRLHALLRDETSAKLKSVDETVAASDTFAADGDTLDADSFDDRRRLRGNRPKKKPLKPYD